MHSKPSRLLLLALLAVAALFAACRGEEEYAEPEAFSFVVYPGSRYLGQLTEATKNAHKVLKPNEEPPPTAIYDTEATVEDVARFYAKSYGYEEVAPDATGNLSAAKPPAYYRAGDLSADVNAIAPLLKQMNMNTDDSKAQG